MDYRMRRRIMLQSGGGSILPSEYQQVEWIGYKGGCKYINTMAYGGNVSVIRATIAKKSIQGYDTVFPCAYNATSGAFSANPFGFLEQSTRSAFSVTPVVAREATYGFTEFVCTKTASFNYNIGLGYSVDAFCPELHFSKLSMEDASGNILFNAIMCYRKSDGVIGMYDTVSEAFRESTGAWLKGSDV